MTLTFTTTDKAIDDTGIKAVVYGGSGVGKTRLCATAPSPLIISAERGLLSIKHVSLPVIIVENAAEVHEALTWCQNNAAKHGIQTVCLDSISEIIEKLLRAEKLKTKDGRAAYQEMAGQAIDLIKAFRDLKNMNVLMTAKEAQHKNSMTGQVRVEPDAPGNQVSAALPYLFDLCAWAHTGYDDAGAMYYALQTNATADVVAKDRSGKLAPLVYPDFAHIINTIATT